jgi:hypothetical protein
MRARGPAAASRAAGTGEVQNREEDGRNRPEDSRDRGEAERLAERDPALLRGGRAAGLEPARDRLARARAPGRADAEGDGEVAGPDHGVHRDVVLRAVRRKREEERQQQKDEEPAFSRYIEVLRTVMALAGRRTLSAEVEA